MDGKRRCHSTSEAPSHSQFSNSETPLLFSTRRDIVGGEGDEDSGEERSDGEEWSQRNLLSNRQTSVERTHFSRRLSLTNERMKETRKLLTKTGSSMLLRQGPNPMERRMSVLVDESRQPVALLQSDGHGISIRPVIGKLPSRGSLTKLFDDPYGMEEEPRTSNISMPHLISTKTETNLLARKSEFEKQCQWKGERVKSTDYMLLNFTALFIISVVVAAIVFFSLWRDLSGAMWTLYLGLGIAAALIVSALMVVKLHFCLKARGFNLLVRSKDSNKVPYARSKSSKNEDQKRKYRIESETESKVDLELGEI